MTLPRNEITFTTCTSDLEDTNSLLFCLCGELDASSVPVFLADAQKVIEQSRPVVMDVHLLEYVDSTGIAAMLSAKNALESAGNPMFLVGCHGLLTRILQITHIETELVCYEDTEAAIQTIKSRMK